MPGVGRSPLLFVISALGYQATSCTAFGYLSPWHHRSDQLQYHPRLPSCHERQEEYPSIRDRSSAKSILWSTYQDAPTLSVGIFDSDDEPTTRQTHNEHVRGPLSLTLRELSDQLQGSGRAAVVWDCLRNGVDPNLYYNNQEENEGDASDEVIANAWLAATSQIDQPTSTSTSTTITSNTFLTDVNILGKRQGQGLGGAAYKQLQNLMCEYDHSNNDSGGGNNPEDSVYTIENSIASLSHMIVSPDGTTKLLLKMKKDGLEVESVIIPWMDKGFSTLCVS